MSNGITDLRRYQVGREEPFKSYEPPDFNDLDSYLDRLRNRDAPESTAGLPSLTSRHWKTSEMGEERGGIASLIQRARVMNPMSILSRLASTVVGRRSDTGYVPGVSEAIYNTIEPMGYGKDRSQFADVLWRIFRGDPGEEPFHRDELEGKSPYRGDLGPYGGFGERRMPISPGREDAFRTYLGLPQEYGTFKEAEYRPTRGSGEDIRTLDFADPSNVNLIGILGDRERQNEAVQRDALEREFRESEPRRNELANQITSLIRLENPSIHDIEELSRLREEEGALHGVLNTPIKEYPDYPSMRDMVETLNDPENWHTPAGGMLMRPPVGGLQGTYTVSKGEDERGPYVSYYDKWDLAPKMAKYSRAGQPFDIYGRMYYDPETYEYRGSGG